MDSRVKRRLVGALFLIGSVFILLPVVFHNGNMKADNIVMSRIAPPPPANLTVNTVADEEAKALTATQKFLRKQEPPMIPTSAAIHK